MIKQVIRESWVQYAHRKHTGKAFNSTTIMSHGSGQITGTMGEMAFGRWLMDVGVDFDYCADDSIDYDFIAGGYRIDVKTSKSIGEPKDYYTLRVPNSQRNQQCDLYVWAYLSEGAVYLLGFAEKSDFWESAGYPVKKGDPGIGKHIEKTDAQVIVTKDLQDMERLEIVLNKASNED